MSPDTLLFLRMLVIGVVVAAPVGAMAVLCERRTLASGWRAGMATGACIATADALYAGIAAFGVTALSEWLIAYQMQFRIIGGIALVWLGWRAIVSPPVHDLDQERVATWLMPMYGSAVGLTLTNPMTIMAFAAIFAGAGLVAQGGSGSAVIVTLGVACGSLSWWLSWTTGVWAVRNAVSDRAMTVVNRLSGALILAFGCFAVVSGVRG